MRPHRTMPTRCGARSATSRRSTGFAISVSSGCCWPTLRRAGPSRARHDLEFAAQVERVDRVVGAAADDVFAPAHAAGPGAAVEHGGFGGEPLADGGGAL